MKFRRVEPGVYYADTDGFEVEVRKMFGETWRARLSVRASARVIIVGRERRTCKEAKADGGPLRAAAKAAMSAMGETL